VLLSGPAGVGKTTAVRDGCAAAAVALLHARPHELSRTRGGALGDALQRVLADATRCRPCVVLLDDAEARPHTPPAPRPASAAPGAASAARATRQALAPSALDELDWRVLHAVASFARAAALARGVLLVVACVDAAAVHALVRDACALCAPPAPAHPPPRAERALSRRAARAQVRAHPAA